MAFARLRISLAALVCVVAGALFLAPARFPAPFRDLASHTLDTPDPITTAQVDTGALRAAGRILPARATYLLELPAGDPQLAHDAAAVVTLLLLPSRRVATLSEARWVLSYKAGNVPAGRVHQVGEGIVLVEVRR